MPANANPLPTAPASRNVREFLAVCARHNVPYGDLNCLSALLREVNTNKHFAMHFWSVVAGMTEKQAAGMDVVLGAIVEAVTGRTVDEVRQAGPAHRILLERLERMLNGQDVLAEDHGESSASAAINSDTKDLDERTLWPKPDLEEEQVLPIRRATVKPRRVPRRRPEPEHTPDARPGSRTPAPEESPRLVLMPEPEASIVEASAVEGIPPRRRLNRLISEEPVIIARYPSGGVPLSGYAETAPRRTVSAGAVIGALVALFVAGGGYLILRNGGGEMWERARTAMQAGYGSAVSTWHGEPAQPEAQQTTTPAPTTPVPAAVPAQTSSSNSKPPVVDRVTPPTTGPAPRAELTPFEKMAATAAANQDRTPPPVNPIPDETSGTAVAVPEATMNSHLIVSRVPVVPDEVRQNGISGVVRMQALINRNGYVSRLHVLQGATELRHPALEAVSAWRYRPYMVNGQPVDVATTITVDFSSLE